MKILDRTIFIILITAFIAAGYIYTENICYAVAAGESTSMLTPEEKEDIVDNGVSMLKEAKYNEAVLYFKKIDYLYPNEPFVSYYQGLTYYTLGDMNKAEKFLLKTIDLDPEYADAYYYLAIIEHNAGNDGRVIKYLDKVTSIDNSYQRAHYNKGVTFLSLDMPTRAIQEFAIALALDPADKISFNGIQEAYDLLEKKAEGISGKMDTPEIIQKSPSKEEYKTDMSEVAADTDKINDNNFAVSRKVIVDELSGSDTAADSPDNTAIPEGAPAEKETLITYQTDVIGDEEQQPPVGTDEMLSVSEGSDNAEPEGVQEVFVEGQAPAEDQYIPEIPEKKTVEVPEKDIFTINAASNGISSEIKEDIVLESSRMKRGMIVFDFASPVNIRKKMLYFDIKRTDGDGMLDIVIRDKKTRRSPTLKIEDVPRRWRTYEIDLQKEAYTTDRNNIEHIRLEWVPSGGRDASSEAHIRNLRIE